MVPILFTFSIVNKLVFSNFLIFQLFQSTAFASFNAIPLLMAGPLLPFLFVLTSSLSFHYLYFSHNPLSFSSLSVSSSPSSLIHHSHHITHPSCRRQRVKVLPTIREKRLSLTTHPLRPRKAKRLPILNRIIPSRRKGLATLATSALLSSIHGMIPIHISLWCLMAIRVLHQAVCGFPLSGAIRNFLGLYWLAPSPISPSVRGMCYPCPSSLNSSQVHHLVGKSGLIRRFPIRVSWVHCSRPVC